MVLACSVVAARAAACQQLLLSNAACTGAVCMMQWHSIACYFCNGRNCMMVALRPVQRVSQSSNEEQVIAELLRDIAAWPQLCLPLT
jgi:hypothetical protein